MVHAAVDIESLVPRGVGRHVLDTKTTHDGESELTPAPVMSGTASNPSKPVRQDVLRKL